MLGSDSPAASPRAARRRSTSTAVGRGARRAPRPTCAIWSTNHGSIRERAATSSTVWPAASAASTSASRSSVGVAEPPRPGVGRRRPTHQVEPGLLQRRASALPSASLNVRPIAITSPTDFIVDVSAGSAPGELLEREPRDLHDHVVERGLERRGRLARDVVRDLVQPVADGEQRGDLRDREAGRLRGQRRRARDARVHLDQDHAGRRAGRTANCTFEPPVSTPIARMHGARRRASRWYSPVGERLRRRHRDRVARVHAHRVDVLDRADDHARCRRRRA